MAYLRDPTTEELRKIQISPCERASLEERALFSEYEKSGFQFLGTNLTNSNIPHREVYIKNIKKVLGLEIKGGVEELVIKNRIYSEQIYAAAAYIVGKENPKDFYDTIAEFSFT